MSRIKQCSSFKEHCIVPKAPRQSSKLPLTKPTKREHATLFVCWIFILWLHTVRRNYHCQIKKSEDIKTDNTSLGNRITVIYVSCDIKIQKWILLEPKPHQPANNHSLRSNWNVSELGFVANHTKTYILNMILSQLTITQQSLIVFYRF